MSRFTSPYHINRPSAQQLADRQGFAATTNLNTVSPLYTDDLGFPINASTNSHTFTQSYDLSFSGVSPLAALSETPTRMPGRATTSLLGYNQPGREHSRKRASRWLVLVLPPSFITESQRMFGHTLSSGPSSRLSQGLLVPLYPTMYAQLGAIAREFNFPSTVGICLYMHINEAGVLYTPRISEESWGILWGHLFEPNTPGPGGGLAISGRIEFDIDMAKARWYDSWISASRRETASLASPSPTHVASMHQCQESKTTVNFEDVQEQSQSVTGDKKGTRRAPRRLSLVERFDLANSSPPTSIPIQTQVPATSSVSIPEPHPASRPLAKDPVLSPAIQESLLSHREEIDSRVQSWRASATFKTNLLASTGQVSLDPANMPNTLPLDYPAAEDDEVRSEMNPGDYSWSITSAGPQSVLNSSASTSSYCVQSVHMDRRVIGSVPLTPETCTSWGPEDYDLPSPASSDFRLPSPDLGQRNLEYCPMTPTTTTSWGPSSEYPPSPDPESQWIYRYRAPSLDLGQRVGWSRPATPSTATSWGPPSEYPPSPPPESRWAYYRPPSVDLGRRAEGSRPVTPSTATSWGSPEEWPPTPTTLSRVSTPDAAQQRFSFVEEIGGLLPRPTVTIPASPAPWDLAWPYLMFDEQTTKPREPATWNYVWPYLIQALSLSDPPEPRESFIAAERVAYPVFKIYPAVYPYFDIYPSIQGDRPDRRYASRTVPETPAIQTQGYSLSTSSSALNTGSPLKADRIGYPVLNIYPAVYPYFEIYPKVQIDRSHPRVKFGDGGSGFKSYMHPGPKEIPKIQPWSFGWPSFQPVSPPTSNSPSVPTFISKSVMAYPIIKIYLAVYPFFDLYPTMELRTPVRPPESVPQPKSLVVSKSMRTKLGYPVMEIYEAIYPCFDIYPKVDRYVPKTTISVRLPKAYPAFDIYPAIYPHLNIYPAVTDISKPQQSTPASPMSIGAKATDIHPTFCYPSLVIYPSVYPWIDVYPSVASEVTRPLSPVSFRQPRTRSAAYARAKLRKRFTANDAPPVPKLPDYVTLQALSQTPPSPPQHSQKLSIQEHLAYPVMSIYPPVYPYFDIYPAAAGRSSPRPLREEQESTATSISTSRTLSLALLSVKLRIAYPQFDIYPDVYPNLEIYPITKRVVVKAGAIVTSTLSARVVNTGPSYPVIEIYKPVYPHFDIYPSWSRTQGYLRDEDNTNDLHNEVFPGSTAGNTVGQSLEPIAVLGPLYPVIQIYNPAYPHFDIYPSWVHVQVVPPAKQVTETRRCHHEPHHEVFPTSPSDLGESDSQTGSLLALPFPQYPAYPALEIYKTAYPHFNIYPSWIRTLVLPAQDVLRPKKARKSYKELHDEVAPRLPTAILDDTEGPTATDGVSRRPLRLTIPVKQRGPAEKLSLSSVPQVSLVLKRVYSLNQINGRNPSPSRPRVSPVFDSFPSIETRLSQPSDTVPVALTRSQSSPTQPPTPKRRQSALIAQRIKALNATLESPEPASDRPARGLTRSLPTPFTRAWSG